MNVSVTHLLVSIIVGAVIGGLTNMLAVKMLFHPFKPVYIGKWRLPFTPGLIPKRREEIAEKLGELVMTHLITADRLQNKINDPELSRQISDRLQQSFRHYVNSEITVTDVPDHLNSCGEWTGHLKKAAGIGIRGVIDHFLDNNKSASLERIFPPEVLESVEKRLGDAAGFLIKEAAGYLESPSGIARVKQGIEQFIQDRGMWGELVLKLIGRQHIFKQIYPEMVRSVQTPAFKRAVTEWLEMKWGEMKDKPLEEIIKRFGLDQKKDVSQMTQWIIDHLISEKTISTSFKQLPPDVLGYVADCVIPQAVSAGIRLASEHAGQILDMLDLKKMVTDQVSTFSLSELEYLIFSISKKELRMITDLGYFLGGLIGFVQGLFFLF
ncbi:DUF445 family protein [Sporolactobacillus sp. THM7-4]|nr:DUF445 family protein [Sporolactobacillus sp. THM7-4]